MPDEAEAAANNGDIIARSPAKYGAIPAGRLYRFLLDISIRELSLSRNDDRLVKARCLGKHPAHIPTSAGAEETADLFSPNRAVFACKLADLQGGSVVDDVLDEAVVFSDPVPGLEEDALAAFRLMDVGRGVGRLFLQHPIIIPDARDK